MVLRVDHPPSIAHWTASPVVLVTWSTRKLRGAEGGSICACMRFIDEHNVRKRKEKRYESEALRLCMQKTHSNIAKGLP